MGKMETTMGGLVIKLDMTDMKLDEMDIKLNGAGSKVESMETKLCDLGISQDKMDTELANMGVKLGGADSKLHEVDAKLGDMDNKLDTMKSALDTIKDNTSTKHADTQRELIKLGAIVKNATRMPQNRRMHDEVESDGKPYAFLPLYSVRTGNPMPLLERPISDDLP